MAKKLFTITDTALESMRLPPPPVPLLETTPNNTPIEGDYKSLESFVDGYCSVGKVYDSVASESLLFIDTKNHVLYNEYVTLISHKLGVTPPKARVISTEDFTLKAQISLNSEIALEGWLGDMWKKIKGFFSRIYEKIKEFFKRYFTRLGRAKGGLENVIEVLKETEKNLKTPTIDNYTGSVMDKFKGTNTLNMAYVKQIVDNVISLNGTISSVNKDASTLATKHLVPDGFITNIKNMKDVAKNTLASKVDVDENSPDRVEAGKSKIGIKRDKGEAARRRADMQETSKTLEQTSKEAQKEAEDGDRKIDVASAHEVGSEEGNAQQASKEFGEFSKAVHEKLSKFVNKPLIAGKTFTKVEIKETLELEIDMATNDEKPETITLGDKSQLSTAAKSCLEMIKTMEKDAQEYGKINDLIMTKLNSIDAIMAEIDKIDPEKLGKYKKLINEQVRTRLKLMQKFFSDYNKIGKNIFDVGIETCEAVTAYSVLSLKYFG